MTDTDLVIPRTGPLAGWHPVGPHAFERCDGARVQRIAPEPGETPTDVRRWRALLPRAYVEACGLLPRDGVHELRTTPKRRAARFSSASAAAHAINSLAPERGCYACNASASGIRVTETAEWDLDTVPPVCRPERGTIAPVKLGPTFDAGTTPGGGDYRGSAYLFACETHRERFGVTS
jgi:hypothetical protein